jgi:hypothetical protein
MPFAFVGFTGQENNFISALPAALFPYSSILKREAPTMKAVNRNTPLL